MDAVVTTLVGRPNWRRFALLMLLWTTLGLIDAGQFYVHVNYFRGRYVRWEEALASGLVDWYVWAALAPVIMALGRRFPLEHGNWFRRLLLHVGAGTCVMLLKVALDVPLGWIIHGKTTIVTPLSIDDRLASDWHIFAELYKLYVTVKFYVYLMIYAVIVGIGHFLVYYRRYRDRELAASRLKSRLAETQLQVLRMQLHPHFLFNTLNAISALMHRDVRLADRMICRLGELLRATLDDPGEQEVTLRRELDFLTPYLEIEQTRVGPRLTVAVEIDDDLLDARLPYMVLQPLVENSIRHGLAPRSGPGRLTVRARRVRDRLVVEVVDDGLGVRFDHTFREGIGLSNTRARLQALYGDSQSLSLRPAQGGGLVVTVTIPYREDAALPAAFDELESGDVPAVVARR
jgi:two-component system, LytTR family, sensor kinase